MGCLHFVLHDLRIRLIFKRVTIVIRDVLVHNQTLERNLSTIAKYFFPGTIFQRNSNFSWSRLLIWWRRLHLRTRVHFHNQSLLITSSIRHPSKLTRIYLLLNEQIATQNLEIYFNIFNVILDDFDERQGG